MNKNYTVAPRGITCEHFPDETIILNLPKGNYYSLKDTGQLIWSLLEKKASSDSILRQLTAHYDISLEDATSALENFFNQLIQEELISEAEATEVSEVPSPAIGAANPPFSAPILEVYTDMQDLLMLDPIHDADPGKGWPHKNN